MSKQQLIDALEVITSRVRQDVTAVKGSDGSRWTHEALTPARIARHLSGEKPRGVCPIKAGESTTRLAVLDLDDHDGASDWPQMAEAAEAIFEALQAKGANPIAFRSSGGRGIHIYLLWGAAQDAYSVRQYLRERLADAGFAEGCKGVAEGQVEIFPKQDEVPPDGYGNQFILPLTGQSVPLEPALGMEPMDRDYFLTTPLLMSAPVPQLERPVRESAPVEPVDLGELREAIRSIPNSGGQALDYDTWRDAIFAIHAATGGSDEGKALAHELSAKSEKYDRKFLDRRIWPYIKPGGGITAATLFKLATDHGWHRTQVADPEDFPLIESDPTEPVIPSFQRDSKGNITNAIENVVKGIGEPTYCGWRIAFDTFRDEIMVADTGTDDWRPFNDADYVELRMRLERRGFKPIGREAIRDAVNYVAVAHRFDSAILWLEGLKWDGKPRVATFLQRYFGCEGGPYAMAVSRYMWSAMAGRVLRPGIKADMAPILVGGQGLGKSTGVAAMVPSPEFFFELNFEMAEAEIARLMRGRLIAEIAELRGLRTRQADHIKAFVSRTHENWTPKYREFATTFARRCLFVGTTNEGEFLDDPTGERRWLPVAVGEVDVAAITRDHLQLWAEGRELFGEHGVMWGEAMTLAEGEHEQYRVRDVWEEAVRAWLDGNGPMDMSNVESRWASRITTNDVLIEALGLDLKRTSRGEQMRAGAVLRKLGFERKKMWLNGDARWAYFHPDRELAEISELI